MPKWIELFGRVYPYVEEIRAKDAWPSAEKGEIVLLDVREPRDIARFGKCQGAIHMPLHMLCHRADQTSSHFDPALDPATGHCRG